MQVEVVPLSSFIHDRLDIRTGIPLMVHESLAADLERRGLVRIKMVARRVDQALRLGAGAEIVGTEAGKAPDDGRAPPSSALPVGQASQTQTLRLPGRGPGRPRKIVT